MEKKSILLVVSPWESALTGEIRGVPLVPLSGWRMIFVKNKDLTLLPYNK